MVLLTFISEFQGSISTWFLFCKTNMESWRHEFCNLLFISKILAYWFIFIFSVCCFCFVFFCSSHGFPAHVLLNSSVSFFLPILVLCLFNCICHPDFQWCSRPTFHFIRNALIDSELVALSQTARICISNSNIDAPWKPQSLRALELSVENFVLFPLQNSSQ